MSILPGKASPQGGGTGEGGSTVTVPSRATDEEFLAVNGNFAAGSTTELTLSQVYHWVLVFFDSAYQPSLVYTLDGTKITFDEPIPAGTEIIDIKGVH